MRNIYIFSFRFFLIQLIHYRYQKFHGFNHTALYVSPFLFYHKFHHVKQCLFVSVRRVVTVAVPAASNSTHRVLFARFMSTLPSQDRANGEITLALGRRVVEDCATFATARTRARSTTHARIPKHGNYVL